MAFVDWPGWPWAPVAFSACNQNAPSYNAATTMDAAGEETGWVVEAPQTGNIKAMAFRVNAVSNQPDNGLRTAFYTISATTGLPTTETHFRVMPGPFSAGQWVETDIVSVDGTDGGAKKAVTRGDRFAVAISFESFVAGDSIAISNSMTGTLQGVGFARGFPYIVQDVGAGWSKAIIGSGGDNFFPVALQYDDDVWYPIPCCAPISAFPTATVLTSSSNPREAGNLFQVPVPLRINGYAFGATFSGNTSGVKVHLYDAADVELAVATLANGSAESGTGSGTGTGINGWVRGSFPTSVELDAATNYRLVLEGIGVGTVTIFSASVPSVAAKTAAPFGPNYSATTRPAAGAWTNTATNFFYLTPYFDAIDPIKGNFGGGGTLNLRRSMASYFRRMRPRGR